MVALADVQAVLQTIPDPEMPISIVDLGIVHDVRLEPLGCESARQLRAVVEIIPTFVGCPALHVLQRDIEQRVADLPGIEEVTVRFVNDPPWSVDRISDAGRESLRKFGVTVPSRNGPPPSGDPVVQLTVSGKPETIACPFCGSDNTRLDSPFGPTRCKMIYYCEACRNAFEHLKRV
jgi:ring-1,2-phenylacetyl-CoA epoxidase subunit PaaD